MSFGAWAIDPTLGKFTVVVDDDIDIWDDFAVDWAISFRVQPAQDYLIVPDTASVRLDPSTAPEVLMMRKDANIALPLVVVAKERLPEFPDVPIATEVVSAENKPVMEAMTAIAAVGKENLTQSLVAGAFGLLLSMVGSEPSTGVTRFDFGTMYLWDGINLVPVIIGLFAYAQVIDMAAKGGGLLTGDAVTVNKGAWEGVRETFRHW